MDNEAMKMQILLKIFQITFLDVFCIFNKKKSLADLVTHVYGHSDNSLLCTRRTDG